MVPLQWSESKRKKIVDFDPSGIGHPNGNLFGLPFTMDECAVVIIPVPWEVTVSYRGGTANAPAAMLEASYQIDLLDPVLADAWQYGIGMLPVSSKWQTLGATFRKEAELCIQHLEEGGRPSDSSEWRQRWDGVDSGCGELYLEVLAQARELLTRHGKIVGVLGGDNSVPLGLIAALAQRHEAFGILHMDAHFDLRDAYEGFVHSHASIMRNAAASPQIQRIVHIGVRDYCDEELNFVARSGGRLVAFPDREIRRRLFRGESWAHVAADMYKHLPREVYVAFDIDCLDPSLCPNTGTPVPGGLGFEEALFVLEGLVESGRRIIGFDLCEVAPASPDRKTWASDWDASVGMRILWRLATLAIKSQLR